MIKQIQATIRRFLPKSAFARGVGVLAGGTVGAQVLLVLASPILTRIYTPEDFGLLAVYSSLLALIGVISNLRYELAIPLPEDDQEAANIAMLCLMLLVISSLLTGILVILLGQDIANVLNVPQLANYLWLLPIGVLLSGGYAIFNYWGIRTKRFSIIASTKLKQAVATLLIQLAAFKLGGIALLIGHVAGQGIGTGSLAKAALTRTEFKKFSLDDLKKIAVRYQKFPKFSTWAGFVNIAGHQLPPIMFAAFFTAGTAGLYALAHRILSLPASLIGGAIGDVFFSHAAESHRDGKLEEMYLKLQDTLIQIGLPPAMLLIVAGPELFALVFSEAWREAGVYAQWLALGIFAGFVVSPLSQIFTILEKQKTGLILQITLFTSRLIAIFIGIWQENLILTVALFSLASLFGYSLYMIMGATYANIGYLSIVLSLRKSIFFSFLAVLPIVLSGFLQNKYILYMALIVTIMAIFIHLAFITKLIRK